MMQVQGSNMMTDMSGNSPASFWGVARSHAPSWSPAAPGSGHTSSGSGGHGQGSVAGSGAGNSDPKMAEKLMTELQVSQYKVRDKH